MNNKYDAISPSIVNRTIIVYIDNNRTYLKYRINTSKTIRARNEKQHYTNLPTTTNILRWHTMMTI